MTEAEQRTEQTQQTHIVTFLISTFPCPLFILIGSWIFVFQPRLVLVALVSFFLRFHVETGAKKPELAPN